MTEVMVYTRKNQENIRRLFEQKTGVILPEEKPKPQKRAWIAATAAVCFILALPFLAATIPGAYEAFFSLSPVTAQLLKPAQSESYFDGIRLAVVSASVNGSSAELYVTVSDTTGDRLDKSTCFYDYSINVPFTGSTGCEPVGYDEETGEKTYRIVADRTDGKSFEGEKLSLILTKLMSKKSEADIALNDLDISQAPKTQTAEHVKGGGGTEYKAFSENPTVLLPTQAVKTPIDGITVTAAGFIDGRLHIRAEYADSFETDAHGYIYLVDAAENKNVCVASIDFEDSQEYIFDVSPAELEEYTIRGCFTSMDYVKSGYWQVTVPLRED